MYMYVCDYQFNQGKHYYSWPVMHVLRNHHPLSQNKPTFLSHWAVGATNFQNVPTSMGQMINEGNKGKDPIISMRQNLPG